MAEDSLDSRSSAAATSDAHAAQHQFLRIDEVDAENTPGSISTLLEHEQPVEFLSRTVQVASLSQTNGVARSSLSYYMELMYKLGMCPHSENQKTCTGPWRKLQKVS